MAVDEVVLTQQVVLLVSEVATLVMVVAVVVTVITHSSVEQVRAATQVRVEIHQLPAVQLAVAVVEHLEVIIQVLTVHPGAAV